MNKYRDRLTHVESRKDKGQGHGGDTLVLPAGEVGRRGGLVGDRDDRRVQLVVVAVGPPAPVVQAPVPRT